MQIPSSDKQVASSIVININRMTVQNHFAKIKNGFCENLKERALSS